MWIIFQGVTIYRTHMRSANVCDAGSAAVVKDVLLSQYGDHRSLVDEIVEIRDQLLLGFRTGKCGIKLLLTVKPEFHHAIPCHMLTIRRRAIVLNIFSYSIPKAFILNCDSSVNLLPMLDKLISRNSRLTLDDCDELYHGNA